MFTYLKDFCAIIVTGITLYEGSIKEEGTLAVYGKGNFVYSLHNSMVINGKEDMDSFLRRNTEFTLSTEYFTKGPIFATVCVPEPVGIDGLENYLRSRGFSARNQDNEEDAARIYFLKTKKYRILTKVYPKYQFNLRYIPNYGQHIASAVSLGRLRLSGPYGCASSKKNQALYHTYVKSPLNMGPMTFVATIKIESKIFGLTYINGHLRVLASTGKLLQPFNKLVWDINPKLDASDNQGLMSRSTLDTFLDHYYNLKTAITDDYVNENILIGCLSKQ